ncbi:DUF862-domain-containing protein [Ceratobasidium sp. AG-I]|nr:DUF862-domain-containing protein [Ceratobasidium sp. AG-I]
MSQVQLYVYDLSGGLAKALSLQMTGKQIDGIWHTSVVVFGKEIFYGQGINTTLPGRSHHGQPLQIVDFGETAIDEDTFNEYLSEIRQHYTADKYHLLDFNCNSFTNDVIGFLTGQHIPAWIRDLPADFLSTPFGASLRPTIDNMFRRPTPGATPAQTPTQAGPSLDLSNLLLQAVAQRAATGGPVPSTAGAAATSTVAAPIHISSNTASFNSLVSSHRVAIALFTSTNCGPCRMIEPVFEDLARDKSGPDIAFVKVSLDVPGGQGVAAGFGVAATPTFLFFSGGNKLGELKGANRHELKARVELLLYEAFPPHSHLSLNLPALRRLSTQPTVYEQIPDLGKLTAKLQSTMKSLNLPIPESSLHAVTLMIQTKTSGPINEQAASGFIKASDAIIAAATPQDLFPLVDLWRLALLVNGFATWCVLNSAGLSNLIGKVAEHMQQLEATSPKPLSLTSLRLLSNISANSALLRQVVAGQERRSSFTHIVVAGLLHEDTNVRTAASTLVFNVSAYLQRSRRQAPSRPDPVEDRDWEVEVLTAVIETLSREADSVLAVLVHRLVSAFGFIVLLSPWFAEQTGPFLEVLDARNVMETVTTSSKEKEVQTIARECVVLCGSV